MAELSIEEVCIIPVGVTGDVEIFENVLENFYNSALVYLLNDNKSIYIGESVDIRNRFSNHNRTQNKKDLISRHAIYSHQFNKSVTLHLEAFLINHFSAEKGLKLVNVNLRNNGHHFHKKKEYEALFPQIWKQLVDLKIAKTSFEKIINSNVFKYSPYKSLNVDQQQAILLTFNALIDDKKGVFIQGNAGTGKTIIAIYILKLLVTPIRYFEQFEMEDEFSNEAFRLLTLFRAKHGITEANEQELKNQIVLVVSMTSLRETLKKVFRDIDQLDSKMVISPTDISKRKYTVVLVDEAHRLRRRKNLSGYGDFDKSNKRLGLDSNIGTELDWILKQSENQIFFYDKNQTIRTTDLPANRFESLQNSIDYDTIRLKTQIRSIGGDLFTDFVYRLFDSELAENERFEAKGFELKLFERFVDMRELIFQKENQFGLSRLVAGFSWEYKTKKKINKHLFDISIEGVNLRWNSTGKDWINSANAIHEVGSIHTVFGNDLNYIAIVFGNEIDYDPIAKTIIIDSDKYKDTNGKNKTSEKELLLFIKNIYKTLIFRGIKGVFLYAICPNLKEYLSQHMEYVLGSNESHQQETSLYKISNKPSSQNIPFYSDLKISAGSFSDVQHSDSLSYIDVEEKYQDANCYFACKVEGESMNKVIPNGSICLFKRDEGGSRNGKICLVEGSSIFDKEFGANYTIKKYSSKKIIDEDGWKHEEIILKPLSTQNYDSIILRDEETMNFKVLGVFAKVLKK